MAESVELATILLTDLVGSTRLATSVGPARADELREEHFELLREAISACDGRAVKNTGDGLMVAFASASAAVRCAVLMQQLFERRYRNAEQGLHVRIGLGAGESTVKDGDYFGMPSIEAARLCDKARTDGILISGLAKTLAGRCEGVEFESSGQLDLKGFQEPIAAFSVSWAPLPDEGGGIGEVGRWPLPAVLRSVPAVSYVGRTAERAALEEALVLARDGSRQVVLLSGEPGIGKTRLASYAAHRAHAEGVVVCWGSCSEELAVPYEPWIEVCSQLLEHAPAELLAAHTERHGGELSRLARNLSRRVEDLPQPQSSDPETERYLLFSAVAGLLGEAAETVPMCLVLDDFHWADAQSVALFKHVVRTVEQGALQVIVTYRDSDLGKDHPLSAVLADLRRIRGVQRITLHGLGADEVAQIMSAAAGHELDQDGIELAGEIAQETDGNPFFVAEVLRALLESSALVFDEASARWSVDRSSAIALPESVRDVIERRVERLGEQTREVLTLAAVIGRTFDLELLCAVIDLKESALLDRLEAAVAASLLAESDERVGEFRFAHALVNQTLYEGLGATRRARLHHRVAEALEKLCGGDPAERLSELALHWRLAAVSVDKAKAADYAVRAGQRALESLAPTEAVRLFGDAVELMGDTDGATRCEALIGLGEARRQIGDPAFRDTLIEAARLAERLGDPVRQARAALATSRTFASSLGRVDNELLAVLEAALAALPEQDDPLRAGALSVLATELVTSGTYERRRTLADEALAMARRIGDPALLADVLVQHTWATWIVGTLDERVVHLEELLELVGSLGDPVRECVAHTRYGNVVEGGDLAGMWRSLERLAELTPRLGQPIMRWLYVMTRSAAELLAGRIEEAEASAIEAAQIAGEAGLTDGYAAFGAQIVCIRRDQGRLDELLDLIAQSVQDNPALPAFRAVHAMALVETRHIEEARTVFAEVAAEEFRDVPLNCFWSGTLTFLADAAVGLSDRAAAAPLYELLLPHADKIIWNGTLLGGSIARPLGALATILERVDAAEEHFIAAEREHERLEAPVWLARTWIDHARLLRAIGDEDRARELLTQADELAGRHGAAGVQRAALAKTR